MKPLHKIIIDTDPGIDDAQAIAFALAHPAIELIGLTTVFGNADIDITTRNALKLLEIFGQPHIPVAKGASDPLAQQRFEAPDFVHGHDALGNLNLGAPTSAPNNLNAAEFIVAQANQLQGELTLVTIGPLTNLAHALELDTELASKIKQVIIMGGTVVEPGNVTPLAEANFICDPHAADKVLSQEWPISVIGLDVTHRTLLHDSELNEVRQSCADVGEFLWRSSRYYFDFYRSDQKLKAEQQSRAPMHDASAIACLIQPELFNYASGAARVITDGIAIGQIAFDRKGATYNFPYWQDQPKINVALEVDSQGVRELFTTTLKQGFQSG